METKRILAHIEFTINISRCNAQIVHHAKAERPTAMNDMAKTESFLYIHSVEQAQLRSAATTFSASHAYLQTL